MKIFLICITIISAILMIIVILLQQGKGAELGAAFGRGAQGGLFTAAGKTNFLTRTTSTLMTIFLLSALSLSVFLSDSREDGVLRELEQSDTTRALEAIDEEVLEIDNSDAPPVDDAPATDNADGDISNDASDAESNDANEAKSEDTTSTTSN